MSLSLDTLKDAALVANAAARRHLREKSPSHSATPNQVALAMAQGFGEALAVYAMTGATAAQVEALNTNAQRAYRNMIGHIEAQRAEEAV